MKFYDFGLFRGNNVNPVIIREMISGTASVSVYPGGPSNHFSYKLSRDY